LYLGRSVEFVVAVLGVLKAGAAYVPLPVEYPAARLEFMLEDTAAAVIVVNGGALPAELAASGRPCLDLACLANAGIGAAPVAVDAAKANGTGAADRCGLRDVHLGFDREGRRAW
jgi:non-ribosomal peptide synthetase component F